MHCCETHKLQAGPPNLSLTRTAQAGTVLVRMSRAGPGLGAASGGGAPGAHYNCAHTPSAGHWHDAARWRWQWHVKRTLHLTHFICTHPPSAVQSRDAAQAWGRPLAVAHQVAAGVAEGRHDWSAGKTDLERLQASAGASARVWCMQRGELGCAQDGSPHGHIWTGAHRRMR
eukprot:812813-Pelagomonas_calceolata.AAC.3